LKVDQTNNKTQKRYTRILKTLYPNFENLITVFFTFGSHNLAYTLGWYQKGLFLNVSLPWNFQFSDIIRLRTLYPKNVISESVFRFLLLSVYIRTFGIHPYNSSKNPLALSGGLEPLYLVMELAWKRYIRKTLYPNPIYVISSFCYFRCTLYPYTSSKNPSV